MRLLMAMLVAACTTSDGVVEQADTQSPDNTRWFLGTWDCSQIRYADRAPLSKQHVTSGVLEFAEVSDLEIALSFRETFLSGEESAPVDFNGTVWIAPPNESGVSGAALRALHSDGSVGEGAGFAQGRPRGCSTCLGTLQIHPFVSGGAGTLTDTEGAQRLWSFVMFGSRGQNGAPDTLSWNRDVQIDLTRQELRNWTSTFPACTRRTEVTP